MTTKLINLPKKIAFPVRIVEVHVSAGQSVSVGDPLYTLETADKKRGIMRAPFAGQVNQGPVEPFTTFSQRMPVIGLDVSTAPSGNGDVEQPPQPAPVEVTEPPPQPEDFGTSEPIPEPISTEGVTSAPQPMPSYGLALFALIGGAVLSSAYAMASIYIPLMFFGDFIPLGVALFLIGLLGSGLRGPAAFRISVAMAGFVLNMAALWFTVFWVRRGLEEAIIVFTFGPEFFIEMLVRLSNSLTFNFGDAKDVLSGSGLPVTGVWLQIIWGIEAAAFAAAAFVGFRLGSERQHQPAGAGVREQAGEAFSAGMPVFIGLLLGTIKGLLKLALVAGVVLLITKYLL